MQKMDFINLDQWRQLNKDLFDAYIKCYSVLSDGSESTKEQAMIASLECYGIKGKVTENDYSSFYTIARELGIFYQDNDNNYHLSELAKKYIDNSLSYSDYLKHYILNTEFLINETVVHPFFEIIKIISNKAVPLEELTERCSLLVPNELADKSLAKTKLRTFLKRAVESNLLENNKNDYLIAKPIKNIEESINRSGLSASEFEEMFIGNQNQKHENVVKKMISEKIPNYIFDDDENKYPHIEITTRAAEMTVNHFSNHPLNQILFGPPGTGKTDSTVEIALDILDKKTDNRAENREIFRSLLNKRIFFVTMHSSYSYEDFVQGLKPKTSEGGDLIFESKDGIFKRVSDLAKKAFQNEGEITDGEIKNSDLLRICFFISKFNTKNDSKANKIFGVKTNSDLYEKLSEKFNVNPNSIQNHRDKFDYIVSDERKGWKPRYGKEGQLDNSKMWPYQDVYEELDNKSFNEVKKVVNDIYNENHKELTYQDENINYVLILDEINRANISRVFGELITLLEPDKRIGKESELSVNLPSGEEFSVPPNLYVIGTMNTADKSIALVDIALRRRFQFKPVYPDAEVIRKHSKGNHIEKRIEFFNKLNEILRRQKTVDFQIGHSYFLRKNSLEEVINENIIPLLTEYYRNDLEKVKGILNELGTNIDDDYYMKTGLLKVNP